MVRRTAQVAAFIGIWLLSFASTPTEGTPRIAVSSLSRLQHQVVRGIDSIIQHAPYARTARFAIDIRLLPENFPLYQQNADEPMVPASINKLVVTAAAFDLLGADFQMPTLLYGDSIWTGDTIYRGNVYLVGSGDPLLSIADLDTLAQQLQRYGIREVRGNIFVDPSFFDSLTQRRQYSGDREIVQSTPPITGLAIERNTFIVQITGAAQAGRPPKVEVFPPSSRIQVINKARTGKWRYSSRRIKVRSRLRHGRQQIIVYGKISRRRVVRKRVYMAQPALIAGDIFKSALEHRHIRVQGKVARRPLSQPAILFGKVHHSLATLIQQINHESDNYAAEQLFKMIGGYLSSARNAPNAERARNFLHHFLQQYALACHRCQFRDGSGLSRQNLLSARTVTELLTRILQRPYAAPFVHSLSVAGYTGTLRKRLRFSPASGAVFAKTGTLRNVSGLAGYILNRYGRIFAFTLLWSGRHISHYKDLEDKIAEFLYTLPVPVDLAPPTLTGPLPLRSVPEPLFSKFSALFIASRHVPTN